MTEHDRNRNVGIIAGAALIALGIYFIVVRIAGPILVPVRAAIDFIWSIGWPLALIGLGVLLIVRRDALHPVGGLEGRRLYRSRTDKMLSGVLGGLGAYLGIDSTLLRIAFALLAILSGGGPAIIAYLIATVVVPVEPTAPIIDADGTPRPAPAAPPIPKPPAN